MKILSWDARSAGRKCFKNQIRILIQTYDPDIIILMETKINLHKTLYLTPHLQITSFKIIPSNGFSGVGCFGEILYVLILPSYLLMADLYTVKFKTILSMFHG